MVAIIPYVPCHQEEGKRSKRGSEEKGALRGLWHLSPPFSFSPNVASLNTQRKWESPLSFPLPCFVVAAAAAPGRSQRARADLWRPPPPLQLHGNNNREDTVALLAFGIAGPQLRSRESPIREIPAFSLLVLILTLGGEKEMPCK